MATAKFTTENDYLHLELKEVIKFLQENGTDEERAEFKKQCYTKSDGKKSKKLNWLKGKVWFCEKYIPEIIPEKQEKAPKISDLMKDW